MGVIVAFSSVVVFSVEYCVMVVNANVTRKMDITVAIKEFNNNLPVVLISVVSVLVDDTKAVDNDVTLCVIILDIFIVVDLNVVLSDVILSVDCVDVVFLSVE